MCRERSQDAAAQKIDCLNNCPTAFSGKLFVFSSSFSYHSDWIFIVVVGERMRSNFHLNSEFTIKCWMKLLCARRKRSVRRSGKSFPRWASTFFSIMMKWGLFARLGWFVHMGTFYIEFQAVPFFLLLNFNSLFNILFYFLLFDLHKFWRWLWNLKSFKFSNVQWCLNFIWIIKNFNILWCLRHKSRIKKQNLILSHNSDKKGCASLLIAL